MPFTPTLHVDSLLSNISSKYRNSEMLAREIFPEVPVKKETDLYRIYTRNFRIPETHRANKGLANEHYFEVSTASYVLLEHALKDYISDRDRDNYDIADLRSDTVEELTDKIQMRMENDVVSLFTSTNFSLNVSLAATAQFSANTTVSNPIPVVDTGGTEIILNSGHRPNRAVLPRTAFINIKNHTSVLDRVKYVSMDISENIVAGLFDLEKLLVGTAQIDSSNLGATESIGDMYPDNMLLYHYQSSPGPKKATTGYVFKKNIPMVKRWRDNERDAEAIQVGAMYAVKIVSSLTGFLIIDTSA